MANIKFSQFTEKTTLGTVDFLVGYTGAENVQISPTNLLSTFASGSGTTGYIPKWTSGSNLGDSILEINSALPNDVIMPQYIRHAGDTNSYFGFYSNDTFILTTNNNEVLRVNSAGNVGIGTNAPVSKLDVIGGVTAQGTLVVTGISQLGSGGNNVYLTSSSAGSVGIGTSSPAKKLDVIGNIRAGTDGNSAAEIDVTSGSTWRLRSNPVSGTNSYGFEIIKGGAGTDIKLAFDSSGNPTFAGLVTVNSSKTSGVGLTVGGEPGNGIKSQYIFSGTSQRNWQIGMATHASQTLSITPSSAAGNTTFTTPILNLDGSDNSATFAGDVQAAGVYVGATNTSYDLYNNGTTYLNGAVIVDDTFTQTGGGVSTFSGNVDVNGNLTVEDEIHLTDGGSTVRGKLLLNSSDRDNVELRAESLGSTMKFFTVGTEALELDASQNATFAGTISAGGAASASAGTKLHVADGTGAGLEVIPQTSNNRVTLLSYDRAASEYQTIDLDGIDMHFNISGTEKMRLNNDGLLFVGDTNTTYGYSSHHIARDYSQGYALIVRNSNTSTQNNSVIQLNQAETTSTDQGYFMICRQGDPSSGTNRLLISSNGNVKNVNNSYGAISDERLKENIVDATPKLNDLMKVKIRNYNFIGQEDKQIGVIAQEIENVFPSLVEDTKDPESEETTKSVKYSILVPIMLKAIQELKSEIEELKSK